MFCHDPEHQWVLMPFPIIFREEIESLNFAYQLGIYLHTLTAFVSEILLVHTILPHLRMVKYHVLSMKYFVDVTLFTPK